MSRVRFSNRATADLKAIGAFIAQHNESAAKKFVARLRKTCRSTIGRFPECGTKFDHLVPEMRCFSVGSHGTFFRGRDPVEILRIVNGAVDFNRMTFTCVGEACSKGRLPLSLRWEYTRLTALA